MSSYPIIADFRTKAAPQAVWDAFAAVERWPEVLPGVGNARIEPPGVFETGALVRFLIGPQSAPVTQFYRVAEAEPPSGAGKRHRILARPHRIHDRAGRGRHAPHRALDHGGAEPAVAASDVRGRPHPEQAARGRLARTHAGAADIGGAALRLLPV